MVLSPLNEDKVKDDLRQAVTYLRENDYDLPRDYQNFFIELVTGLYQHFREGNKPLLEGLRAITATQEINSVADFCCGSGKHTIKLARVFPNAEVYGFDIVTKFSARKNVSPRIHFEQKDVYDYEDERRFDIITFNSACGTLADRIMQIGIEQETPIIAGRFCCYSTIPKTTPRSKDLLQDIFLVAIAKQHQVQKEQGIENYISPANTTDQELLSRFAIDELSLTESELRRIAAVSVDAKVGSHIIDLNRVMKLIEKEYAVTYDETRNIILAKKKGL